MAINDGWRAWRQIAMHFPRDEEHPRPNHQITRIAIFNVTGVTDAHAGAL